MKGVLRKQNVLGELRRRQHPCREDSINEVVCNLIYTMLLIERDPFRDTRKHKIEWIFRSLIGKISRELPIKNNKIRKST